MRRFSLSRGWWIAPIFLALCFACGLRGPMTWFSFQARSGQMPGIRSDRDADDLANGLQSHPNFVDTFDWWQGPWLENVPYFRPLTMTGFWLQEKALGQDNLLAWEGLHWLWHGVLIALIWGFWSEIAGKGRAALGVGLFAASVIDWVSLPTGADAFNAWKDSADVWSLWFFVGSAWCFLRFLRTGNVKWWIAAFLIWVLGLSTKETAFALPFLLPLLVWHEGKLRTHWKWTVPFFVFAPMWWLYRSWALGGYGNRTGKNGSWMTRWGLDAMGLPGRVLSGDWMLLVPIAALTGIGLAVWRRETKRARAWMPLLIGAIVALISLAVSTHFTQIPFVDNVTRLTLVPVWIDAFNAAIIGALYWQFFHNRDRAQIFAYGWVWVTFIPLAIQPPTSSHVHYPVAPGWGMWLACALWPIGEMVWRRFVKPEAKEPALVVAA